MKKYIEIRPCSGGKESEALCLELFQIYKRVIEKKQLNIELLDANKTIIFIVSGEIGNIFQNESGIHKFQRISSTGKNETIHTSTISVAIIDIKNNSTDDLLYHEKDIRIDKFHCGGKGGQNVNKVETGIRVTHIPTNTVIVSTNERTQYLNKESAFRSLEEKLKAANQAMKSNEINLVRHHQIKDGDRANAKRIYNLQRNEVLDKETNKKCSYKDFTKGKLELLA